MTSKQRVFSHSTDINYNDYIKNKNAIEIFKDIKTNHRDNQGHNPNNFIIKKFANHQDLINFTKTYYKYVNLNKYSLNATRDLYNSNISLVDVNLNNNNNLKKENDDYYDCHNSNYYNDCSNLSQVLYPESYYVSNNLSGGGVYLHFNLDLNKWCVNKTLLDYNKIYNFDNNVINIDGFNGCTNSDECYNLQPVKKNDKSDRSDGSDGRREQKPKKCRTGMCGNAKPLFV
jgi:hypothetical protein